MPNQVKMISIALVSGTAYTAAFYATSLCLKPVIRAIIES
jgi:hypothetical protein